MKRINIKQAFVGEANPNQEGIAAEASDEQVQFEVRSGTFSVVVPGNSADNKVFDDYGTISGELLLEDGTTVRFEIPDGVEGATFMFNRGSSQSEPMPGMSTATAQETATPNEATMMAGGTDLDDGSGQPANQGA